MENHSWDESPGVCLSYYEGNSILNDRIHNNFYNTYIESWIVQDVVGRAKGQGQDKSVLINRARKNANKGKGQRVGADKKMSKGMF